MDESRISNPKLQDLRLDRLPWLAGSNLRSCNFGFEMRDSSDLQFPRPLLLLDRNHRLVDEVAHRVGHVLLALTLSPSPCCPGLLLRGDILFNLSDLPLFRLEPNAPLFLD